MTERLLRLPELKTVTGLSRSTIYSWIKDGTFPRQVKLGERAVAWRESEIDEWLFRRIAASADTAASPNLRTQ